MLARMMTHSELLELKGTVSEVVLHLSGRKPPLCAPPDAPTSASPSSAPSSPPKDGDAARPASTSPFGGAAAQGPEQRQGVQPPEPEPEPPLFPGAAPQEPSWVAYVLGGGGGGEGDGGSGAATQQQPPPTGGLGTEASSPWAAPGQARLTPAQSFMSEGPAGACACACSGLTAGAAHRGDAGQRECCRGVCRWRLRD